MALALLLGAHEVGAENPAVSTLGVTVSGIKNSKGVIRLVICPPNAGFPECNARAVRTANLDIARGEAKAHFADLAAGSYAIGVFHDANGNGKLDTFLGIPREGYGFSRNPPFRPRAPRFDEAVMTINGPTETSISLRYIL